MNINSNSRISISGRIVGTLLEKGNVLGVRIEKNRRRKKKSQKKYFLSINSSPEEYDSQTR